MKEIKIKSNQQIKEYKRKWYIINKEKILKNAKNNYLKNRDSKLEYSKNYREDNFKAIKEYKKEYRLKNKELIRQSVEENKEVAKSKKLNKIFGITLDEYNKMFNNQMGLCKICGNPESSKTCKGAIKMLAVDHCHETNKIRGLLCQKCNISLGLFNDNIFLLENAIEYLISNGKKRR